MTDRSCPTCEIIAHKLKEWVSKQGHEACWYYPEIFRELCSILGVDVVDQHLPTRGGFEEGCRKYQGEIFSLVTMV